MQHLLDAGEKTRRRNGGLTHRLCAAPLYRGSRVAEDIAATRVVDVAKLPEFVGKDFRVSESSTARVKHCAYSVPSRLIGERVRVRILAHRIVVRYGGKTELDCDRLRGRNLKRLLFEELSSANPAIAVARSARSNVNACNISSPSKRWP